MMKKEISIWQFVRIMVEAEENPNGAPLLKEYKETWADVDSTLNELAQKDMEEYSNVMMENQIIITDLKRENADIMMEMASAVIERMTNMIDEIEDENHPILDDLAFEIQGLEQFVDEIS